MSIPSHKRRTYSPTNRRNTYLAYRPWLKTGTTTTRTRRVADQALGSRLHYESRCNQRNPATDQQACLAKGPQEHLFHTRSTCQAYHMKQRINEGRTSEASEEN